MPNRLAQESSPYLQQHGNNPVDWFPWGAEALARALAEDKPIFLSIGYAACHWCHVMEHESFEDAATAEILNRHFVCIKVDRVKIPLIAPSLGGVESLIEQPALMSFFELDTAERLAVGIKDNLIRLALGIEDTADLIADLQQALANN